jgi:O-antigen ligase
MLFRTTSARGSRDKGGIGLRRGYLIATVATAGLIISFIAIAINSVAFERLRSTSLQEESRVSILGQLEQAVSAYFPLGSGFGTFDPVYRLYESSQQLAPTYWNHAHNDFFELLITGGLFGLLGLLGLALWIFVNAKKFFASRDQPLPVVVCRLIGICTVLVLLLGSVVDYPLRVPSLGCLFVLAMVLISRDWTDTRLVGRS